MKELSMTEVNQVNGGDGWDIASGGLTGAGAGATLVGLAVGFGITVTAPITLGVIAVGAAGGALYNWIED